MMENYHAVLWKWAAILLLCGGVLFWVGAFLPPYRQWTTQDVREYLTIIGERTTNWYVIHGFFMLGVLTTLCGVILYTRALGNLSQSIVLPICSTLFAVGCTFWLIDIGFRVTVTVWAAKEFSSGGAVAAIYIAMRQWSGLLFAVYMVLSYFCIGCLGWATLSLTHVPTWLSWSYLIFGFAGVPLFIVGFPLYAPPLMVHLPFMISGITMLVDVIRS